MLTNVQITTDQGAVLMLPLQDPSEGYLVKDIDGLDPVKANMVSSSFANLDGEQYQSSRREPRNIIFKLGLNPDYTTGSVRELRKRLYGFFMPKTRVHMRFFAEGEDPVDIYGRIETFDAPLFTREPEATISLICHQPDFYSPDPIVIAGNTVANTTEFLIDYEGDIETGIKFKLSPNRSLSEFTIYHRPADNTLRMLEFDAPLSAGDVLDISTISRAKGATLTRAGAGTPILYGVSPFANWINLYPGPNYLRVYAAGAAIPYTIEYNNKFGGL